MGSSSARLILILTAWSSGYADDNEVRKAITAAYASMVTASMQKDEKAWLSHIAPGFSGVGQTGRVFSLEQPPGDSGTTNPSKVLSERYEIQKLSVSGDAALVLVHHRELIHLVSRKLNGRNLGLKPDHLVRVDEIMRQVWVKLGQEWKLKHWDDLSGKIWVDKRMQESWAPDRLMTPEPTH